MKRIMTALITCGLASPLAVMAADEIKANVGIVSDYVFRGVSQTDNNPAVQGGVDYNHQRGLYAGAWATNVDIPGSDAKARLDLYGGYKMKLSSGLGFDAGLIAYPLCATPTVIFGRFLPGQAWDPLVASCFMIRITITP